MGSFSNVVPWQPEDLSLKPAACCKVFRICAQLCAGHCGKVGLGIQKKRMKKSEKTFSNKINIIIMNHLVTGDNTTKPLSYLEWTLVISCGQMHQDQCVWIKPRAIECWVPCLKYGSFVISGHICWAQGEIKEMKAKLFSVSTQNGFVYVHGRNSISIGEMYWVAAIRISIQQSNSNWAHLCWRPQPLKDLENCGNFLSATSRNGLRNSKKATFSVDCPKPWQWSHFHFTTPATWDLRPGFAGKQVNTYHIMVRYYIVIYTSSTAQGGGGSFKNR